MCTFVFSNQKSDAAAETEKRSSITDSTDKNGVNVEEPSSSGDKIVIKPLSSILTSDQLEEQKQQETTKTCSFDIVVESIKTDKKTNGDDLDINCEFCGRKYPFSYSDIDAKTLEALKMVGDSVKWFCSNCEDKSTDLIEKFKKLENDVAILQKEIARLQKTRGDV